MSAPVIHYLANDVTAGRVADAIAAAGGRPIMSTADEEVAEIASRADAVVLSGGTPSAARLRALCAAGLAARAAGIPVVLDPVGCGASAWRTRSFQELAAGVRPTVIRGGAAEIAALAGIGTAARLRGVASSGGDDAAVARAAAERLGGTVVVGRALSDGRRNVRRSDGPAVIARVVGAGDVLDALIALACAGIADAFVGAELGLARFDAAAARAAERGPGTFWPAFLDALASA